MDIGECVESHDADDVFYGSAQVRCLDGQASKQFKAQLKCRK